MDCTHEEAVADQVNVDFDVDRIRTEITERGGTIDAALVTALRNRQTRKLRREKLDEDVCYGAGKLDRTVVARDQIRTVVRAFRERLFTEIFPRRFHPAPSPDEQRRIVGHIERRVSLADALDTAIDRGLRRGDALGRSILELAYTGRLGTHDSTDEPASMSLERVARDRAGSATTRRRSLSAAKLDVR